MNREGMTYGEWERKKEVAELYQKKTEMEVGMEWRKKKKWMDVICDEMEKKWKMTSCAWLDGGEGNEETDWHAEFKWI